MHFAAHGNKVDEVMRASLGASATAGAELIIHLGNAILNRDGIKFAGSHAIAIADAAIAAAFFAAIQCCAGSAGSGAMVIFDLTAFIAGAGAVNNRLMGHGRFIGNTQISADLAARICAAGDTEVGFGTAISDGFCVVVTTGKATSAAVGAGQHPADILRACINRN